MGRPKKAAPPQIDDEDFSQEVAEVEAEEPDEIDETEEEEPEPEADQPAKVTKADAIREAIREGIEKPDDAVAFIKSRFGLDISKTHWSASRSQIRKKEGIGAAPKAARAPRQARSPAPAPAPAAPAAQQAASSPGMVDDLAAVKALVKRLGAAQVKQIADLFED